MTQGPGAHARSGIAHAAVLSAPLASSALAVLVVAAPPTALPRHGNLVKLYVEYMQVSNWRRRYGGCAGRPSVTFSNRDSSLL